MVKVSVVVPVYNGERYIRNCLDSLLAQTLEDVEIVVVNDGSTDRTLQIAEEYACSYSCLKVFSIENKGVSHARNYGLLMARGDYVSFVDSDDTVECNYCKEMYDKAIKDGNDLVVCEFDRITLLNNEITHLYSKNPLFEADNFKLSDRRELFRYISVGPWDKLFKRELLNDLLFPEEIRYAEDQLFSVKAFCLAKNIGTVKKTLYHYYYEIHNGITSDFGNERMDWIKVMEQINSFVKNNTYGSCLKDEIEFFMLEKSLRLCSAAIVRIDADYETRLQLVKGMYEFFNKNIPEWRKNKYYIADVIEKTSSINGKIKYHKGKRVKSLYCNYGKVHSMLLIKISHFIPQGLFDIVLKFDKALFWMFRSIRWKIFKCF